MLTKVAVIGAGGFGREVLDILESLNRVPSMPNMCVLGVVDDSPSSIALSRLADRGYEHLGSVKEWLARTTESMYIVAIGDPVVRSRICSLIESKPTLEPISLIHPSAVIGSKVKLGVGSVVCAGVRISTNVDIGKHVHLNPGVIVGHDTTLADYVSLNPGAILSGEVVVRDSCLVGAGAVVLQGLMVGAGSTVGAGGVVTRDVDAGTVVKGVPAR